MKLKIDTAGKLESITIPILYYIQKNIFHQFKRSQFYSISHVSVLFKFCLISREVEINSALTK